MCCCLTIAFLRLTVRKTDARLRHALATEAAGKTVIVVAQRIATVLTADKILVLEDGELVGMGTHKELLSTCPYL